jgi:hypothetical protein
MDEDTRLKHCHDIAERMYFAGLGWNFDTIERFTRPQINLAKLFQMKFKYTIMRKKINHYLRQKD